MSQAAAQAAAFLTEVARGGRLWALSGKSGMPTARTRQGHAVPFWSSQARAEAVVSSVAAYREYEPVELNWVEFRDKWLADLEREGLRVGVNWTGQRAMGYDFDAASVRARVEAEQNLPSN